MVSGPYIIHIKSNLSFKQGNKVTLHCKSNLSFKQGNWVTMSLLVYMQVFHYRVAFPSMHFLFLD